MMIFVEVDWNWISMQEVYVSQLDFLEDFEKLV